MDEVVVESTRGNKSINEVPTRVEVLGEEEIEEAASMDPSKIAHLITHTTGVQVQNASPSSNYGMLRIQGLQGKYALFLKDGFPLYGGFSGNLSIMHLPPLDLRQVEYIKGSASTLYGGGAISGIVNLISKLPTKEPEASVMINRSHIGATDFNAFFSQRKEKIGLTVFASHNLQAPYDADGDRFSDLPRSIKSNVFPKIFIYLSKRSELRLGAELSHETRQGGDLDRVYGNARKSEKDFFLEENHSQRLVSTAVFLHEFPSNARLTLKSGYNLYERNLLQTSSPDIDNLFSGRQMSSFNEASYFNTWGKQEVVLGTNYYFDQFDELSINRFSRDWETNTIGFFGQHTSIFFQGFLATELGLRADIPNGYEPMVLPRASMLFHWSKKITTRVGGGFGYLLPTVFVPDAEVLAYRNVLPIDRNKQVPERSQGFNADINYKTPIGDKAFFRINQLFFITQIQDPLQLVDTVFGLSPYERQDINAVYELQNQSGSILATGFETSIKMGYGAFTWYLGYTYTDAQEHFDEVGKRTIPLTAKHSIKGDILVTIPDQWQLAFDYTYISGQPLSNGDQSPDQLIFGAVVRRMIKNWTLFANFENFTDVRQTRHRSLVSNETATTQFTEIWAPLDGFYANVGFKLNLP